MSCDIADFQCTFVNELIGSQILAVLILGALFFAYCSKTRIGFKTTIWLSVVFFPVVSYFIVGTNAVFAIVTFVVALLTAFIHTRITGNR